MLKKGLIIGSLMATGILALFLVNKFSVENEESYAQNGLKSLQEQNANDAMEWMKARYVDVNTGQPISTEKLAEIQKQLSKLPKSKSISFMDHGPDNIGGRTRAIQVCRVWNDRIWAGGVSGGLFVSYNGANTWTRMDSYIDAGASPFISSMTQTIDGTLYVGTGSNQEQWNGNGVWYSTDFGATWDKVPGVTQSTEVVSSDVDNFVWMATSNGLRKWKVGDSSPTTVPVTSGGCFALNISRDGQVIVTSFSANRTYVSTNGGESFTDKSGTANNNLVPTGASRIEYAISPNKNSSGNYSLYAARTNANLLSMHVSHDNGQTWTQFVGASGPPNEFDIYRDQGTYNSILAVNPTNAEELLIGGIDVWRWNQTVNNPPSGGFEKISLWFANPSSPIYVHADNHEMKWDKNNRFYVGNDGGIGISNNFGATWFPANRGYNVTQFYGISFDRDGKVIGGTQDNGTLYNDHSLSSYQEYQQVNGGDGFDAEISFFNPRVMFSSVYYNAISRSGDRGQTFSSFVPSLPNTYDPPGTMGSNFHPFRTTFILAEYYDTNSKDSVTFIPTKNYAAGSTLRIPSLASGDTISYVTNNALYFDDTLYYNPSLTSNGVNFGLNPATGEKFPMGTDTVAFNVSWDTLRVQDPFQSWFLVYVNANGGELWGTRNALRLSVTNPLWVCVARGFGGGTFNDVDIKFTKNLQHLFISSGNGVWRVDGLGSVYTSDPQFIQKVAFVGTGANATTPTFTTATKIVNTNHTGLAVNPNNPNDLILFSGFGGVNKRTLNATAANPSFTNLSPISSPNPACYDGIIDRLDSDIIVVGTSNGVFVSENGGLSWQNASTGFEGTPVYEVHQSWRSWEEGNGRPGEIHIGTFGRGIWTSTAYLSTGNGSTNKPNVSETFKTNLKSFPNPSNENTNVTFEIQKSGKATLAVYTITGQLVKTISLDNVNAGTNTVSLESSDLPRGTYIVKLVSGKQSDSSKFIKL